MGRKLNKRKEERHIYDEVTAITVQGFKSICHSTKMEVRPLTILAGANSSGKSSIMQPLLLLKQTLHSPTDPGALRILEPNVKFTSADQILSRLSGGKHVDRFIIRIEVRNISKKVESISLTFRKNQKKNFDIAEMTLIALDVPLTLRPEMTEPELSSLLTDGTSIALSQLHELERKRGESAVSSGWEMERDYCFLKPTYYCSWESSDKTELISLYGANDYKELISDIIHVPGLRGNPERSYEALSVQSNFPGTFENYVASIIVDWQEANDDRLTDLYKNLSSLGLAARIDAKRISGAQIELNIGRLPSNASSDFVNIADVGFGVSQVLPVIMALLVADPGQLVYIEQPELHLHPNAQVALAKILADAAKRGVRVVAETHSSLLLLAIQTLVAQKKISPDLVKLHWFERGKDGITKITSSDLDEAGSFEEDWPMDFDDVSLNASDEYLTAAGKVLLKKAK
ncbi:MAG TPA: AAA family ATPase [bacterium]|nr:AAA family ATPase [bacterium]